MEKHYSIDPGKGEKMDGCPYSIYEDGHDVKDYIIPPKGYYFVGFKFEPLVNNQIYDGKLVAQYEKSSLQERLTTNLWKILIPIIIVAVIGLVVLLAVSIFRNPKSATPKPKQPQTETIATPTDTLTVVTEHDTTSVNKMIEVVEEDADVIINLTDSLQQPVLGQEVTEEKDNTIPTEADPNVQFKNAFWTLIHERTIMMDPYDALFKEYKNKVEGEEYDYLRLVILKDYPSFKEWYVKLHKIPVSELETIKTVNDLKSKLNTIE